MADFNFTTGPSTLPDVGELSYNGCKFSPLFETNVSGSMVSDEANRTVKYMEYTITADGYVTSTVGQQSIDPAMSNLRRLLTQQGGALIYRGRGCDIVVNRGGGAGVGDAGSVDVAWGPVPEILEFQPLGAGCSAKIKWQVKTRIVEQNAGSFSNSNPLPLLQFNYETSVSYAEDGFSTLSCNGILEVPLTRRPDINSRTLAATADNLRKVIETRIMSGVDMSQFRFTRREFKLSRDKRTLEWGFTAEEKPYMDLPQNCTSARGSFSIRPAKAGMGMATWLCTLRATYTVRGNRPRRTAWLSFLLLLRLRMACALGLDDRTDNERLEDSKKEEEKLKTLGKSWRRYFLFTARGWASDMQKQEQAVKDAVKDYKDNRGLLLDFSVEEGVYQDSKNTTFSATWRISVPFNKILLASGLWRKVPEFDPTLGRTKGNYWAISMRDVNGSQSWLENHADPKADAVIDFGF